MNHRDGIIKRWAIADGRHAAGVVELADDGMFIARDVDGNVVGRFKNLAGAAAAFDFKEETT